VEVEAPAGDGQARQQEADGAGGGGGSSENGARQGWECSGAEVRSGRRSRGGGGVSLTRIWFG
jgi:hypothetical protein